MDELCSDESSIGSDRECEGGDGGVRATFDDMGDDNSDFEGSVSVAARNLDLVEQPPHRLTDQEKAQAKADATMKQTRPRSSTNPKTMKATLRRSQTRLAGASEAHGR